MTNHGNLQTLVGSLNIIEVLIRLSTHHKKKKNLSSGRYKPFGAYCHSKLANILHANELSRRLKVIIHIIQLLKYIKPGLKI